MTLLELQGVLPATGLDGLAFPRGLLGAFRRKSITFCTGVTDEATIVYWFQSRSFTIDLRLPDGHATPIPDRQGWIGDTLWDEQEQALSWSIATSYQPHNQWPEPAKLRFIGNSVLEFAPSGAYVEDWRQQCTAAGPLLGLRLLSVLDEQAGRELPMDGGLILAGDHVAFAQSRLPHVEDVLGSGLSLKDALVHGVVTEQDIESYEVSVAMNGRIITHSTRDCRLGQHVASGDFAEQPDGTILMSQSVDGKPCRFRFALDVNVPDFSFDRATAASSEAEQWMDSEAHHLFRHAQIAL